MAQQVNIQQLFGDTLLSKQAGAPTPVSTSILDGKYVGVYFSAHWCPPCRGFTPRLMTTYKRLTATGKPFEIVFVSHDHDKAMFDEYYNEMPWAAVPFEQQTLRRSLARQFGVQGIPSFVILAPDGTVANANARGVVLRDPEGTRFPWQGEEEPSQSGGTSIWMIGAVMLAIWLAIRFFTGK